MRATNEFQTLIEETRRGQGLVTRSFASQINALGETRSSAPLDETLSMHELATELMHEMYAGEDEEQAIVPTVVVYTVDGSRGRASVALVAK